ncbi:MAG TPA: FtsX-like permease family protein [Acidimicrobiales bacterium]|nr:FtsX-like permease family protein [Acidimicrobiales bacterium]
MPAIRVLVQNGLRRRAAALVGLALVIALGIGTALASFSIAWRTDHAYTDYLRRAEVGELVVNPSLVTDRINGFVASTPGVLDTVSDALFVATPDEGEARARIDVENSLLQFRASSDGRYQDRDRPVVHRGRMIRGNGEAFLSLDAVEALEFDVGDEMPVAFWTATPNEDELDPAEVVESIGSTRVRVVGVGVFSDEVLPDELYPRRRVLLSPDVVAPFDCTPPHPPPDDALTLEQLTPAFFPQDCSRDPAFFSLKVSGGDRGVPAVVSALSERLDQESARLPKAMRDRGFGFSILPTVTAEEQARVQRSLAPSVTALRLFGLVAALSTLAMAGLGGIRSLRRIETETRVWSDLGMTRGQRAAAAGLPLAVAGGVGIAAALAVGWVSSHLGPVASARAVVADPQPGLPLLVAVAVVAAVLAVLAAEFGAASWLAPRDRVALAPARTSRLGELAARSGSLPLTIGVRAALPGGSGTGAGARAVLVGAATAVAAVIGCVVFSSNLSGLVANPARFGWPFDVGVVINLGYAGADEDMVSASLDRPEVEQWGFAALPPEVTVNGQSLPAVAGRLGYQDLPVPVVAGRYPTADDEIALGVRSAESLGLAVGDRVAVATAFGERDAEVAGFVVLPSIGPFQADRVGLGTGLLLSARFFDAIVAGAEQQQGLPPGAMSGALGAFVGIDLRDGVDAGAFVRELQAEVKKWDVDGIPPIVYPRAVRPPEITDVAAIRRAPAMLAALLAATMAAALALAITLATRARRRELAILRALGCTARQLRSTVAWHSFTVVGFGLAVGILIGTSMGSVTWREFSGGLGVVPSVRLPLAWMTVVTFATAVVALLAAAVPARTAVTSASAHQLRDR